MNKKSLTLGVIKKILENKEAKQKAVALFERKHAALNDEIKSFLKKISALIHPSPEEKEQSPVKRKRLHRDSFQSGLISLPPICF